MNKYEILISKLLKKLNTQDWEYVLPRKIPDSLKKAGVPDKVFKVEIDGELSFYLYTVLLNKYDEEYDHEYKKEYLLASLFHEDIELETFGAENVNSADLYALLHNVQNKVFNVQSKLDKFLDDDECKEA